MNDRDTLVERYLPLARRLARRFSGGGEPLEDLEQVAAIGLLKAIDRYDPTRGAAFTSFAVPTITGELKRHFRDHGWHLHVPRALQEQILQVRFVEAGLLEELGRSATASELAYRLGWTVEAVLEVRAATAAIQVDSLEKPFQTEDGQLRLGDRLGAADPRLLAADDLLLVRDGLNRLSPRDRMIVVLRLEHDLTQEEIAARVGLSQMHVSRIIRKALTRLSAFAGCGG